MTHADGGFITAVVVVLRRQRVKKKNLTQILYIRLVSNGTESRDPCGSASVKIPHSAPRQAPPAVMQQNAKQQQLQVQRSCSTSGRQRGGGGGSRSV